MSACKELELGTRGSRSTDYYYYYDDDAPKSPWTLVYNIAAAAAIMCQFTWPCSIAWHDMAEVFRVHFKSISMDLLHYSSNCHYQGRECFFLFLFPHFSSGSAVCDLLKRVSGCVYIHSNGWGWKLRMKFFYLSKVKLIKRYFDPKESDAFSNLGSFQR